MVKPKRPSKRRKVEPMLYRVEVFTKARIVGDDQRKGRKDGKSIEYFVKWAGYDSDENSWEPECGLVGCERLVESFWKSLNISNPYCGKVGTELKAPPPWIRRERELFAQSMQEEDLKKGMVGIKKIEKVKPIEIPKPSPSVRLPETTKRKRAVSDDEDEDDTPSLLQAIVNKKMTTEIVEKSQDEQASVIEAGQLYGGDSDKKFNEDLFFLPSSPSSSSSLFGGSPTILLPESHDCIAMEASPPPVSPKAAAPLAITSDIPFGLSFQRKNPPTIFLPPYRLHDIEGSGNHSHASHVVTRISTKQRLSQGALVPTLAKDLAANNSQKWLWSGPFEIRNHSGSIQSQTMQYICNIGLFKITCPKYKGLELATILSHLKKVKLASFHDVDDFHTFSKSCKPPCQLGQFGPHTPRDVMLFSLVVKMMVKARKVAFIPISHKHQIGHIILFPSALSSIQTLFQVPSAFVDNSTEGTLTAAIIPWVLPHPQLQQNPFKKFSHKLPAHTSRIQHQEKSLECRRKLILATQVLGFPRHLYKFFRETVKDRTFSIWWKTPNDSEASFLETSMLKNILDTTYGRHVGYGKNARVIFVHVSSLETFHTIPALVDRRVGYPCRVQFYTYGTAETVPRVFWGIQEIYPCGGVVTFSPRAFLKNPLKVMHMLKKIHKHPFWTSYLLPQALGMLAKLSCMDGDPLRKYDQGDFPYTWVLKAIEEGMMALLTSPKSQEKVHSGWTQNFFKLQPPSAQNALELAIRSLKSKFETAQMFQWDGLIEKAIELDLKGMQNELAIMREYRRYVILTSDEDKSHQIDGLEWITISNFEFKDEFHSK